MREIKFRAWDKEQKIMLDWNDLKNQVWNVITSVENPASNWILQQYTGLKDKNGVAEVYECDIIDTYGNIKGNIYEMDKRETDLVIQGFGTSSWEATNKKAMARGLKYSE